MFCNKCGTKVKNGTVFCTNCGNKLVTEEAVVTEPVSSVPKKKNGKGLIALLIIVALAFVTSLVFLFINIFSGGSSGSDKFSVKGTTWTASDSSEMIFEDDRLYWYKDSSDHNDNYYSGIYKLYVGKEAVDYITTDLSSYGVTKSELEGIFDRNEEYDESNFVVFDINYDKYVLNGKNMTIPRPQVPLYGFILKNNTYLDVANMNTGSYYKFTKN